ncbi:MAG: D-aminoacylase [Deltaproteobacteria bacterium]|jgi:N-acyl-D-amino-acid deacylase|nr:D-aminoacylase [Deltaproteobacteria bacterium]
MKTLIKDGLILDGGLNPPFLGSVAIEGEKIVGVGQIAAAGFDQVIEANGLAVAPGFIDTHSHSDVEVFENPHLWPKLRQGVTTEFLGQDGISVAPLPKTCISPWRKNLAGLDGDTDKLDWTFETTERYMSLLEKNGSGTNLCYLIPHGNVRMQARGLHAGTANPAELKLMTEVLDEEMKAGAFGLSTGLIYMPCAYADTLEMVELCRVAAKHDVPLVIHQRSEADAILASMEEVLDIGRRSGVKIHFSHFKICGQKNAVHLPRILNLLEEAKKEGLSVSFDQYPYVAGSTMLGVILPPWVHDGGTDKLLERLASKDDRLKMTKDIANGLPGWDNFIEFAGFDGIFVTSVKTEKNQEAVGLNLTELGRKRGKEPLEAAFDLLWEEGNAVGMVDYYGLEEHVKIFLSRPEQNVCTDGLMGGQPHPRAYGAFARVLGKYCREEKVMTLPEAIHKMTGRPAAVFGLTDRGLIKEGLAADLVIFDPATVIDVGTFTDPRRHPSGIKDVFVNGQRAVKDGENNPDVLSGKVLKKKS